MVPTAAMSGSRIVGVGGMPGGPKTGAAHCHAQLGLPGKTPVIE